MVEAISVFIVLCTIVGMGYAFYQYRIVAAINLLHEVR
jgi:hypothetical protein